VKIMIADNYASIRFLYRALLTNAGYEIIAEADNGTDSLASYFQCSPDLLIIDNKMGGMSGIEVVRKILHVNRQAKIIMCTANHEEIATEAIRLGVLEVISKPFDNENVINSVFNALNIKQDV
jgi:two-component system chemotaxis response regulator CheY